MAADGVIRWTTAGVVAGAAAMASCEHACALVRAHGEAARTGRPVLLTMDGLIYAASIVMPDSARGKYRFLSWRGGCRDWGSRNACGQRGARPRQWPGGCHSGRMAGGRTGRLL